MQRVRYPRGLTAPQKVVFDRLLAALARGGSGRSIELRADFGPLYLGRSDDGRFWYETRLGRTVKERAEDVAAYAFRHMRAFDIENALLHAHRSDPSRAAKGRRRATAKDPALLPRTRARVENMEPADVRVLLLCARGRTLSPADAHHASTMNDRYGKILIQRHTDKYQLTALGRDMAALHQQKSVVRIFDPARTERGRQSQTPRACHACRRTR